MQLLTRVSAFAARHTMWRRETRILAAVSGGSDSVALLWLLHDLAARREMTLDSVAHLHHGIRGGEADEDETFCRALAQRLDCPFISARIDVPAVARRDRQSLEVAARRARRAFLDEARRSRRADLIATAHTADDQAETVLMRLVRGAGVGGLGGIAPVRGVAVRPLLECGRDELQDDLRRRGQPWREDSTNADLSNPRNRVRHELIPYLEQHFNPNARRALVRLADLARTDDAALARESAPAAFRLLGVDSGVVSIDVPGLLALPEALARRVIRYALVASNATGNSLDAIDAVRAVAGGECPAADISGLRVEHSGATVVLVPKGSHAPSAASYRRLLPVPGAVQLPGGWTLEAEGPIKRGEGPVGAGGPAQVELDSVAVGPRLIVRNRRPGDRLRPLGLGGWKKVQDVLVDRKVKHETRDFVPIVTDAADRIVWVAGHVLGEDFRVTGRTNTVVILKLRRVERQGPHRVHDPGTPRRRKR